MIFCDPLGRSFNPVTITVAFQRFREAAKMKKGRLHDTRHTHATLLLLDGVPLTVVSKRLGHGSSLETLRTYSHLLPTSDEEAAEVFGSILAG